LNFFFLLIFAHKKPKIGNKIQPFIITNNEINDYLNCEENEEMPMASEEKRDSWDGKLDFILSALSYSGVFL
jgi:hypothetical protein